MNTRDKINTSSTLRSVVKVVSGIIFGIALVVCTVMGSFATFATNADYYKQVQDELGVTHSSVGLSSDENMMIANDSLADYMAGRIDDMQVTVTNYGAEVQLWSDQALKHMKDVRDLVSTWTTISWALAVYMACYIVYNVLSKRGRSRIVRAVIGTYETVGVVLAILAMSIIAFGFGDVFTIFHKIFFTNNDWLFPSNDLIVRLLPQQFFLNMAITGGVIIAVVSILLLAVAIWYRVRETKLQNNQT